MSSRTIRLNSQTNSGKLPHEVQLTFPSFFEITDGEEICLSQLYLFNSWFNVTNVFNNTTYSYVWINGTTYTVQMPEGNYSYPRILEYLYRVFVVNGHYLLDNSSPPKQVFYLQLFANDVQNKITVLANPLPASLPSGWTYPDGTTTKPASWTLGRIPQLVVPSNAFSSLIGWNPGTYPASQIPTPIATTPYEANGQFTPNLQPVISVDLACNFVSAATYNSYADVLSTFITDAPFSSIIKVEPTNRDFLPCIAGRYNYVTIGFYDQQRRPLQLTDSEIVCTIRLQKKDNLVDQLRAMMLQNKR